MRGALHALGSHGQMSHGQLRQPRASKAQVQLVTIYASVNEKDNGGPASLIRAQENIMNVFVITKFILYDFGSDHLVYKSGRHHLPVLCSGLVYVGLQNHSLGRLCRIFDLLLDNGEDIVRKMYNESKTDQTGEKVGKAGAIIVRSADRNASAADNDTVPHFGEQHNVTEGVEPKIPHS
ncbi:hypothetical protein Btru_076245, partial [Bulinus truncatus]